MTSVEEALLQRHSVRQYTDEPISEGDRAALNAEIERCNKEGNLHMALVCDEPQAFAGGLAHYGSFRGVANYIVIAGQPSPSLDEHAAYFGEKIVLLAQQLGLNTCWVALTFKKRLVKKLIAPDDKLVIVIAIGHGVTQGAPHKSRTASEVSSCEGPIPEWFARGVKFALLAPTAINQQKFHFALTSANESDHQMVRATTASAPYAAVDLGIAKLHFEIGAGDKFTFLANTKSH